LEHLRARFYRVSAYNYHLAAKLIELTSQLEQAHISVLAFKGPAAAIMAYGDLALRQYEDLDLVIRVEDVWKAVDLMIGSGFQTDADSYQPTNPGYLERYHAITLEAPDKSYNVDVHWQLARDHARDFGPDIARFWERTERLVLPQGSVSTLCREDMFLALCLHGTKHRWGRLKWLLDIAELLRKAETLDWSRVEEMASSRPAARASGSLGVLLARELLEIPVPAKLQRCCVRRNEPARSHQPSVRKFFREVARLGTTPGTIGTIRGTSTGLCWGWRIGLWRG